MSPLALSGATIAGTLATTAGLRTYAGNPDADFRSYAFSTGLGGLSAAAPVPTLGGGILETIGGSVDYARTGEFYGTYHAVGGIAGSLAGTGGGAFFRKAGTYGARLGYAGKAIGVHASFVGGGAGIGYAVDGRQGALTGAMIGDAIGGVASSVLVPCFPAGTPILTPEGHKPIEELKPGDLVLARDEQDVDGPVEAKVIEEHFTREGVLLNVHVGGEVIQTTPEHPFYVRDQGWTPAGELAIGDELSTHTGAWIAIDDLFDTGEPSIVYNFRVAEHSTYFVGSDDWGFAVWVHNSCSSNAKILGKNLEAAGYARPKGGYQAAHIVPSGNWSKTKRSADVKVAIADAQTALKKAGIDINDELNGFWAVSGHGGTHKDEYLLRMGDLLRGRTKHGQVKGGLQTLWKEIERGDFM